MNIGKLIYCVSVGFSRKGDLEALDKNGLTPILTAEDCKNYDARNTMIEKGGDSLKSTLFQAAKKMSKPNIQALKVMPMNLMFIFFPAYLFSASIFFLTYTNTSVLVKSVNS